jgi:hypothetical protein
MKQCLIKLMGGVSLMAFLLSSCASPPLGQETNPPAELTPPPIIMLSETPESTDIIRPTLTPLPTELAGIADQYHCYSGIYESPSKTWVIFNDCQNPPPGPGGAALLYNTKTDQYRIYPYCTWMHACDELFGGWLAHLSPIAWSPDGESLYAEFSWGGDSCAWFPNFSQLLIFDLATGVSSIYHERAALYKLSPDLSRLAIIVIRAADTPVVIIRDLADGTQFSFNVPLPFIEAGDLAWSPDGAFVAFIAVNEESICYDPDSFSVMLIDVSTRHRFTIIEDYENPLHIVAWQEGHILELMDEPTGDILRYSLP